MNGFATDELSSSDCFRRPIRNAVAATIRVKGIAKEK